MIVSPNGKSLKECFIKRLKNKNNISFLKEKKIIGFSGEIGSGKTTVSKCIKDLISFHCPDLNCQILAYATPLKRVVLYLMDFIRIDDPFTLTEGYIRSMNWIKETDSEWVHPSLKEVRKKLDFILRKEKLMPSTDDEINMIMSFMKEPLGIVYRRLLQFVGTEIFRRRDEDFWVRKMEQRVSFLDANYIFIDDVRMENELDFIHKNEGIVIFLKKQNLKSESEKNISVAIAQHRSETEINNLKVDFEIVNYIDSKQKTIELYPGKTIPLSLSNAVFKSALLIGEHFSSDFLVYICRKKNNEEKIFGVNH